MSSIKKEMRSSFLWNAIENFSRMGVQFVIGIILARILSASDYGILGIISVFIAISQTLIDAGFSNALLQKKECTNDDYCTVFWVNVSIGFVVFLLCVLLAPFVGAFFDSKVLIPVLRTMGVSVLVQSFYTVHKVRLTKKLKFKFLAYSGFFSSLISGILAIILAYSHFGVWALVFQSIAGVLFHGLIIVVAESWKPVFLFSRRSFNTLFSFGSKLLASNLLYTIFNNLYNIVIGKCFLPSILGYFTRADGYAKLVPNNISGILQNIMLPVLSKQQDDDEALKRVYFKFIRITSLFIFPLTLLFCAISKPIILLMLTDKWAPSINLLQILCIASLFDHLLSINNNYLMVKGKSNYILQLSASTKVFLIVALVVSFPFGIVAVAWSKFAYSVFTYIISAYFLNKVLNINIIDVCRNIFLIFISAVIVAICAWLIVSLFPISWYSLLSAIIVSLTVYYVIIRFYLKNDYSLIHNLRD